VLLIRRALEPYKGSWALPAGYQEVWHFHLHVFPRYPSDELYALHASPRYTTPEERAPYAARLRSFFAPP